MSIALPPGLDLETVVRAILETERCGIPYEQLAAELVALGVSEDDVPFAYDRVLGGLARAATHNGANAPSPVNDPIAALSYRLSLRDPTLSQAISPAWPARSPSPVAWPPLEPLPPKPWWVFWR